MRFEGGEICTVMHVFGQEAPEGGSSSGEGSVAPGPVLGSEWWRQGVWLASEERRQWEGESVEQGSEVAGGLVVEGSVGEEEDFEVDVLRD